MEINEEKLKNSSKKFRVNDVTAFLNVTPRILKHYETTGILEPKRTDGNDYREYTAEDVIKVQLAERLKNVQLTQSEIRAYFSGDMDIEKKHKELLALRKLLDELIEIIEVDLKNGLPRFSITDEQALLCFCKEYPATTNPIQQYLNSRDAYSSAISAKCVCDVAHTFFKQYDDLDSFSRIDGVEKEFDNATYRVCVPIVALPPYELYGGTVETVTRKKSLTMKFALDGAPLSGDKILKDDAQYRGGGFYLQEEAARRGLTLTGKSWSVSETGPNRKTANRSYSVILGAEIE